MKQIKFSHDYFKLPDDVDTARLVLCEEVELGKQTRAFLDYDTEYLNEKYIWKECYPLPKTGRYLLLGFLSSDGAFFTTLRRHTPQKAKYYREAVGEVFKVIVEEGKL